MRYQRKPERTGKRKNRSYLFFGAAMLGFSLILAGSAIYSTAELRNEQRKFEQLSQETSCYEHTAAVSCPLLLDEEKEPSVPEDEVEILPQYQELAQRNPELFGWIKIDNTVLDYPVMYTPEEPEKYLRRNFDGEKSTAGTIFLDHRCSEGSDNLILYGHNMKNGTMFGSVLGYQKKEYWEEHPVICFDTLYEKQEYEVMAAFFDEVHHPDDTCFKYYNFIDAENETEFANAVRSYRERSLYDTGISAQYGDQLLTVSTCSYHTENGRFVVVARKVR